jgi:hypothetical protein
MSLGKGAAYGTSIKQKFNTKSSTEAKLVTANDVLPQVLWTQYVLEAQGYQVKDYVVYQENSSAAMLLEKNGKGSTSKRTCHVTSQYFFIKDRIRTKEVSIEHCPTGVLTADFFTKPLQGSLFHKFCDKVVNIK